MSLSDVITSGPSTWGAANAASAAVVHPLAIPVAALLAASVSDPAQMWHAGDRYAGVAKTIRTAVDQMTAAVDEHARADKWTEAGRRAFLATRCDPYRRTLKDAADMYDEMDHALKASAIGYTGVGLASAIVGMTLLQVVAEMLAAAVVPGLGEAGMYVANARMVQAGELTRTVIGGQAKLNGLLVSVLAAIAGRLGMSAKALGALTTAGSGVIGGYFVGFRDAPMLKGTVRTLGWPSRLKDGEPVPKGFRGATAEQNAAIRRIHPESIDALAKDLDKGACATLSRAYEQGTHNDVGYPGFGVIGLHVAHAHAQMRADAAKQLAAGRDAPGSWLPALKTTGGNWIRAEEAATDAVRHGR